MSSSFKKIFFTWNNTKTDSTPRFSQPEMSYVKWKQIKVINLFTILEFIWAVDPYHSPADLIHKMLSFVIKNLSVLYFSTLTYKLLPSSVNSVN